jgi:dolichyl-phosphate-mannose--protein O-mannosyl transferase
MTRTHRLLLALLVGVALAKGMEALYGYWAAFPMPWLRFFAKHTASYILLLFNFCVGIVPAYVIGRLLFRYVSNVLWAAALAGLPWVLVSIYYDYPAIRGLQSSPALPSAQATLHSWLFPANLLVSLLSVPLGLWLAFKPAHTRNGALTLVELDPEP